MDTVAGAHKLGSGAEWLLKCNKNEAPEGAGGAATIWLRRWRLNGSRRMCLASASQPAGRPNKRTSMRLSARVGQCKVDSSRPRSLLGRAHRRMELDKQQQLGGTSNRQQQQQRCKWRETCHFQPDELLCPDQLGQRANQSARVALAAAWSR